MPQRPRTQHAILPFLVFFRKKGSRRSAAQEYVGSSSNASRKSSFLPLVSFLFFIFLMKETKKKVLSERIIRNFEAPINQLRFFFAI